jgi:hypothetical protein
VTLDNAVAAAFTVDVTLTDGTATGGPAPLVPPEDYDNVVATLNFAGTAGETQGFTVATLDDAVVESSETFTVSLAASDPLVTDTDGATGTITDNDVPTVAFTSAAQTVGEAVGTTTITVALSQTSPVPVTVPYTVGGTATAPDDYTLPASPLTIPAGNPTGTLTVTVVDDGDVEPAETVVVTLGTPTNATLGSPAVHTVTLTDNDVPLTPSVYSVGSGGRIWHYNGTSWSLMTQVGQNLFGVWGTASDDVFAVGATSTIVRYDGSSWNPMTSAASMNGRAVWGTSSSDVYLVGEGGTRIQRYNGTSWSTMTSGLTSGALYGVGGTASNNVFAVGYDVGTTTGIILRYDGATWSPMTHGATVQLDGVWAAAFSDVIAVGDGGTILRYNGANWSSMTSGTSTNLNAVWGTSSSDVYAVGDGGTILHYDGSSWSTMTSPTSNPLLGVWGTSATDVYAVGISGTALHYDGVSWSTMSTGTGFAMFDVWTP